MQAKLRELQSKLSEYEESDRLGGEENKKLKEVKNRNNEPAKPFSNLIIHLIQELESVRASLNSEKAKNTDLGAQMAKMGAIITTSQEALQQEQKNVELLKAEAKVGSSGGEIVAHLLHAQLMDVVS